MHENNEKHKAIKFEAALVNSEIGHYRFEDRRDTPSSNNTAVRARHLLLGQRSVYLRPRCWDCPLEMPGRIILNRTCFELGYHAAWTRPSSIPPQFESVGLVFQSFRNILEVLVREPGLIIRTPIGDAAMGHS
jgi:hypothetical protein